MHMQRRMYQRFDGYDELKPLLEGSDEEILRAFEGKPVLVRIPAASTVEGPRARLVSCLLHGNEPSGFEAMVEVLRRGDRFPFDLWVLIGNVRAATELGLFAHRRLDDQEDFNRVWDVDPTTVDRSDTRQCAAAILDELRGADLEAAVDIHNNSGRNPYYSVLTQITPEGQRLGALCADLALFWRLRAHTLMEALAPICPAVSVECGRADDGEGTAYAMSVVHRFLTAEEGFTRTPPAGTADGLPAPRMIATEHCITVRPEATFSFGPELAPGDDLTIMPGLDAYNFSVLPASQAIAHVAPGRAAPMPLLAIGPTGVDVTDQLFRIDGGGRVVLTHDVVPIMMTTTVLQTQRDCLFYTSRPVVG
jgi:hypothetical protein